MEFIKRIFKDYLEGKANSSETAMVDTWYAHTEQQHAPEWITREHLRRAKSETLQNLSAQLNFPVNYIPQRSRLKFLYIKRYLPYAAALILVVTGWAIVRWLIVPPHPVAPTLSARQVFATPTGVRRKLTLSDGTTVWLNNGSRLSLSATDYKNASTREVWLDEGEAYFEVAKNPQRPFIVHVDSLQTRVLGTAFNIQAYRELANTQILVSHGSVQVSASDRVLDTLGHNRQLIFYSKSRFFVTTITQSPEWWNNRFVLDKASFKELVLRLQLKFGVQVSSNNQRILQTSFSAGFPESASLEQVLAVLCTIYKTSYRRVSNRIIIQ